MAAEGTATRRFEVWGDPIAHSLSPDLHSAAYAHLGRTWTYGRRRVDEAAFAEELGSLDAEIHGLSLTMPLKTVAHAAAHSRDEAAELTGAANTLVRSGAGFAAFNTDVGGLAAALLEVGAQGVERARIVGAGATATSALVSLQRIGAARVEVAARRPDAAAPLRALADRLGVQLSVAPLAAPVGDADLTVSTLPGAAPVDATDADRLAAHGGILFDVVYGTWPTVLGAAWLERGLPAHPGAAMLLHQAVRQIRVFTSGDPDVELADEHAVVAVMRRALVGG